MSTKTKTTRKSQKNTAPEPQPSYEFLDMLSSNAIYALTSHLSKNGAEKESRLLQAAHLVIIDMLTLLAGGTINAISAEYIYDTVRYLSDYDVEWSDIYGTITPLKELKAMYARKGKAHDRKVTD